MTSSVPEHNLRQINKNKEERDQEKKWGKKKEETLIAQTQKVIRQTRGIVGGGWGGFRGMKEQFVLLP